MGLLKKASRFLNRTIVGKAISSLAPKATGMIKAMGSTSKGTTAAVKSAPIVTQTQITQRNMDNTQTTSTRPKWLTDLLTFFSKYYLYLIGGVVISVAAWFFLIKKKKVVRKRTVRRK